MAKYETHDFYCLRCGRAGVPVMRKLGTAWRISQKKIVVSLL